MGKIIKFLSVVALIAGVVFLVFPIAAVPDETVVGFGAIVAALLGIVREIRGALGRPRAAADQQLMQQYEAEIGSLLSGNPARVRGALTTLRQKVRGDVSRHFRGVDWDEFERTVSGVLRKAGFNVDVSGPTHDLAARVDALER
jgi:hypothetical protein